MPLLQGLQHYEQQMLTMAEHFDDFIIDRAQKHPNIWYDRIPRAVYDLFSGLSQKTNIYRGGLPHQVGINNWTTLGLSRKPGPGEPGYDNCVPRTPQTYGFAWETLEYTGVEASWQSNPFCLNDLKFVDSAKEQIALILRTGVDFGISIMETFNREKYIDTAVRAGRAVVLADGALSFEDASAYRFAYDPTLTMTDSEGEVVPYLTFSSSLEVSTLSWKFLDYFRYSLNDRAAEAALSSDGGMATFGLMIDYLDFERFVLADASLKATFDYAVPMDVIKGYNMGLKVFRGYALMHDARQARFRFHNISGSNVIATRVKPWRNGRAVTVGNIPEPDPAYYQAELAIGVIFMNDVLLNKMVPSIATLGSGTSFGPSPGMTGDWKWLNIQDKDTNPLQDTGFFYGRFQLFPKPMPHSKDCTVFLYRRCPQAWKTVCGVNTESDTVSGTSTVAVAADAVAADFDLTNRRITVRLASRVNLDINDAVSVVHGGGTVAMRVAETALAPIYTFTWASGAVTAPTAYTDFTTSTTVIKV